jgi:glyceraldehyde-3-phosphate dehydrogenase/erythrose-4-phosphate dehydrogenase
MVKVLNDAFGLTRSFTTTIHAASNLVKIFGWYDNEWGYTCRPADLAVLVGAPFGQAEG